MMFRRGGAGACCRGTAGACAFCVYQGRIELTCLMGSIVQEFRGWSHMSARSGHEGVAMKTIRVIALFFGVVVCYLYNVQ